MKITHNIMLAHAIAQITAIPLHAAHFSVIMRVYLPEALELEGKWIPPQIREGS
jgi:hypothetical protein